MGKGVYLYHIPLQASGAFPSSSAHTFFLTLSFMCPQLPLSPLFCQHLGSFSLFLWFFFLLFSEILSLPDTCVSFGFIWVQLIKPGFHLGPTANRRLNSTTIIWLEPLKYGCNVPFPLVVAIILFLFVYSEYILSCSFVSRKKFLCMHYLSINPLLCCVEAYSCIWSQVMLRSLVKTCILQ